MLVEIFLILIRRLFGCVIVEDAILLDTLLSEEFVNLFEMLLQRVLQIFDPVDVHVLRLLLFL